MPYIKPSQRATVDAIVDQLISILSEIEPEDRRNLDGYLNYCISKLLLGSMDLVDNPRYTKFNSAVGVLESAKLELYRRFVATYEDEKIHENGDII